LRCIVRPPPLLYRIPGSVSASFARLPACHPHATHRLPCRPHCTRSNKHQIISESNFPTEQTSRPEQRFVWPHVLQHPRAWKARILPISAVCPGARAADDDQSAGREENRNNARDGRLTRASIGKSQSKSKPPPPRRRHRGEGLVRWIHLR
jgi:hypothetical protein